MNYLVEEIGKVVAAMRTGANSLEPYYLFGHKLDIANRLLLKNNDEVFKDQKYPLVALFMDFPELIEQGLAKYTLHVVILNLTDANYTIEDRYAKVFKPVLYPLYESFMSCLKKVGKFSYPGDQTYPPHTKIDRPYWGMVYEQGNDRYIFNDRLDAIEITDLKISKTFKKC